MGELRNRMEQDMRVRDFSVRTIEAYVAAVRGLAKYYRKAPDRLSDDEIHRYLIYVHEERKLSASSRQQIRCGLRFFYEVTARRPQACLAVPTNRPVHLRVRTPRRSRHSSSPLQHRASCRPARCHAPSPLG